MTKKIALLIAATFATSQLAGCDGLPAEINADLAETFCSLPFVCSENDRVILDLQEINNTGHHLAETVVQRPEKSDVRTAGTMMRWNKKQKGPVHIKVWWAAVYDRNTYYHSNNGHDREKEKQPRPGSVWCEAVVKIKQPYRVNPRHLNVYFYPDGRVEAEVAAEHPGVAVSEDTKALLSETTAGKYCEKNDRQSLVRDRYQSPWRLKGLDDAAQSKSNQRHNKIRARYTFIYVGQPPG